MLQSTDGNLGGAKNGEGEEQGSRIGERRERREAWWRVGRVEWEYLHVTTQIQRPGGSVFIRGVPE